MATHTYSTGDHVMVDVHNLSPLVAQQHGISSGTTVEAEVLDASSDYVDDIGNDEALYELDCVNVDVQFSDIPERRIEGLA